MADKKRKKPLRRPHFKWNDVVKRDVEYINGGPDWKEEQLTGRIGGLVV